MKTGYFDREQGRSTYLLHAGELLFYSPNYDHEICRFNRIFGFKEIPRVVGLVSDFIIDNVQFKVLLWSRAKEVD